MKSWALVSFTVVALGTSSLANARTYREYQIQYLQQAGDEEAAEDDSRAAKRFARLARQARDSGAPITLDDLPQRWRTHVRSYGKWSEPFNRLLALEAQFNEIGPVTRAANRRLVAHAQVDLFHARHELSEYLVAVNSADDYLDHAARDLGRVRYPDRDRDDIIDDEDDCPDDPEDYDGYEDDDGCPDPDNDSDGILDVADRCPLRAGRRST